MFSCFRIYVLIAVFGIICNESLISQERPPMIHIGLDAPDWMKMMADDNPDVFRIQQLYEDYYRSHPFEKNSYTQYYKRFMRYARPYTDGDGQISIPDAGELAAKERTIRKWRNDPARMANWIFVGPNETWTPDANTKVTWQTNIYCIDIAPTNANILYAGGESGGLWKTTNKGISWTLKTGNILHGSFNAVKVHPANDQTVYTSSSSKILKTTDGGNTWLTVYTESGLTVYEFAFSSQDPQVVVAATSKGLLRTTNGGGSWTKIWTDLTWTVKKKEGSVNAFFAIRDQGNSSEFMISTDNGLNWTTGNTGWWAPGFGESVTGAIIATCPTNTSKVYAYLCGNGGTLNGYIGVFVSNDSGSSWQNTNPSGLIGGTYSIPTHTNLMANNGTTGFNQGFYDMAIVVNPTNENQLIAGGTSWFKSTDGGATWNSLGGYVGGLPYSHPDIQWLAASGSDLWIASDGGLNYSSDFGVSHEARMNGITGSDMWGFGSGWNTDLLVGGRYHNGNMAYHESFPAGKVYRMGGGEAATGYVNPGPGNKVYFSDIGGRRIRSGFGSGVDNFSVGAWPNESYAYYANSEMVFHPNYYNSIFIGKDNILYKSTDGGLSYIPWYTFPGTTSNDVYEISIARSNPSRMYCSQWDGTDDKLWKSDDGGATWTAMTPLPLPNNNDRVKMDVSNTDQDVIWVGVTYGSNGKKIYKSVNGGASWTNLTTATLDNVTVQDVLAQYGTNGGVYLGTDAGVFYRNNTHADWQPFSTGLPVSVETNRLKPFYRDNKIRNGCWGFGIWESPLFESSQIQAMPTVAAREVGCTRDTVYFDDYSVLNHAGAAWQWTFQGASYVSSTSVRNPKVVYSNPGTYDVTLTITNGQGQSDSKIMFGMVTVLNKCQTDTIPGKALVASGTDKHGYVPDFGLTNVSSLTVTAWVKPNGIQPDYSSIFMGDGTNAAGFNFKDGTNKLAYHWPGGQWWWDSNINVPADQWSFVAMVVKPTGITVYCNEQSATHSFTLTPTDIPAFRLGSYRNWTSRNMNGQIDEVAIYNRALTTSEIRNLRHLTKKPADDLSLIAYYQFNSNDASFDYDKVGIRHVQLMAGATKTISTVPAGGGVSSRMTINSGGLKDFGMADVKIYFPASGTFPNGEVVVSKINLLPDQTPAASYMPSCYWVINNYGTNLTFTQPESIRWYRSGNISGGCQNMDFMHYRRGANAEGPSWGSALDAGDSYNPNLPNPYVTFSASNGVNAFGQFILVRDNKPNNSVTEICNGIDDDCDGLIDENYSLEVTVSGDSGVGTLRQILFCAQNGDIITFAAGVDTITLLSPLTISRDVSLHDQVGQKVVIRSDLNASGFTGAQGSLIFSQGADVLLRNIHLRQSNNTYLKPLIRNAGNLTLHDTILDGNPEAVLRSEAGASLTVKGLVKMD